MMELQNDLPDDDLLVSYIAQIEAPGTFGHYLNFWNPPGATGILVDDIATGEAIAREALQIARKCKGSAAIRYPIIEIAARGVFSGIEIGFLSRIADAARRGSMN